MAIFSIVRGSQQLLIFGVPAIDLIAPLALVIAFVTLLMTARSSRETARANTLAYLPVINLEYDFEKNRVVVVNLGKGTAVDIQLDKYYNWSADKNFKIYGLSKVTFGKVHLLEPAGTKSLQDKISGIGDPLGLTKFTIFSKHTKKLRFVVKFKDISGKKYYSIVSIRKGEVRIDRFPKGMGLKTFFVLGWQKINHTFLSVLYRLIVNYKKHKDG